MDTVLLEPGRGIISNIIIIQLKNISGIIIFGHRITMPNIALYYDCIAVECHEMKLVGMLHYINRYCVSMSFFIITSRYDKVNLWYCNVCICICLLVSVPVTIK